MDKIERTETEFKKRIDAAIKTLTPITKVKLSQVKAWDKDFGATAYAPSNWSAMQKAVKAQLVMLNVLKGML